ncbi:MAG: AbrB/MazE/SpoVT family DNA-binding domain-containing protein [Candidatus Woesearchaeota archaeon]|nr:MAG: AbrB/MazE/SpoVT family DNA-binding domain-containing protein [Candidatus Woesearchaeota archaeon]
MADLTTISTKGQVVIPQHIREELSLEEGSQLVVSRMEDFVVLKKVSILDPKKEFEELTKIGERHAKKIGIKSEEDVVRIVHEARKKRF